MSVVDTNPYANHPQLSSIEQQVLWEYAKLGDKVKRIAGLAKLASESPNESLLAELRELEKKMGLVLTLFKASVWAVLMEHRQAAEEEEARVREQQAAADVSYDDRDWSEDSML